MTVLTMILIVAAYLAVGVVFAFLFAYFEGTCDGLESASAMIFWPVFVLTCSLDFIGSAINWAANKARKWRQLGSSVDDD